MADVGVVMVVKMGRVEAVIWGREMVGFGWFLVCFWLRNCCSGSGVSCWYFV